MPKHGTSSNYTTGGCRCEPCGAAHRHVERRRRELIAAGQWEGLIDPTEAREHLRALLDGGMTREQVISRSGVTYFTLRRLLTGQTCRIQSATAQAILGTKPEQRTHAAVVDATSTRRRLQSLQLAGWTLSQIINRAGSDMAASTLGELVQGRRGTCQPSTRDLIARITRTLDREKAPDTRYGRTASRRAAAAGWVDLAAWDDIDDPTEKPKGIPSEGAPQGPPRVEDDVIATIHRLHRAGLTDRAIAYHLGYSSTSAIQKLRHRHREEDAA